MDHDPDQRRSTHLDGWASPISTTSLSNGCDDLWQEAIYLEEISDGFQARRDVKNRMKFYNTKRPHSALERLTPDEAY